MLDEPHNQELHHGSNIDKYFQTEPEPMEIFAQNQDSSGQPFTVDETEIQNKYSDLVQYAKTFAEKQETVGVPGQGASDKQQVGMDQASAQIQQGIQHQETQQSPIFLNQLAQTPKLLPSVLTPAMTPIVPDLVSAAASLPGVGGAQRPVFVTPNMPNLNLAVIAQRLQQQQALVQQQQQQQQQQQHQCEGGSRRL